MDAEEPRPAPPDSNIPPVPPIDAPTSASFEGWSSTLAPDLPPDPPPPAWRWETSASLGLLGALLVLAFVTVFTHFHLPLRRETAFMLVVSVLAFGVVLGYSGAQQGGSANRNVATVATIFHMLLLMLILFTPIL
jgi:hypothetical protein